MLLQVLHSNIQHKDRLLTKQRVTRVETNDDGVKVYTQDGSEFTGDIVVGADGIHSTVRNEMWRNGGDKCPGYFPDDEDSRPFSLQACLCLMNTDSCNRYSGLNQMHLWYFSTPNHS
jgi:2-polyprenyl-6-methoxyphenol hydroxylase-like FAD-dependent oxidoreductase